MSLYSSSLMASFNSPVFNKISTRFLTITAEDLDVLWKKTFLGFLQIVSALNILGLLNFDDNSVFLKKNEIRTGNWVGGFGLFQICVSFVYGLFRIQIILAWVNSFSRSGHSKFRLFSVDTQAWIFLGLDLGHFGFGLSRVSDLD